MINDNEAGTKPQGSDFLDLLISGPKIPVDEVRKSHDDIMDRATERALLQVSALDLPTVLEIEVLPLGFGLKIERFFQSIRDGLQDEYGDELSKVMAAALHEYWISCYVGAEFFRISIEIGDFKETEFSRAMATPNGYVNHEGWANTLSNAFASIVPSKHVVDYFTGKFNRSRITQDAALKCMSLFWINQARVSFAKGRQDDAFDLISEAFQAERSGLVDKVWNDAFSQGGDDAEAGSAAKARSDLARKAGNAAHAETRMLKDEVRNFWRENISPLEKNDTAAGILIGQFPLSFRVLSGYVSEFKKNTPS